MGFQVAKRHIEIGCAVCVCLTTFSVGAYKSACTPKLLEVLICTSKRSPALRCSPFASNAQITEVGPRNLPCIAARCNAVQEPLAQLRSILHAGSGNEILVAVNDSSCLPSPRCAPAAAAARDAAGRARLWLKQLAGRAPLPPPLAFGAVDFDPPPYLQVLCPTYAASVQACLEAHEEWIRGTAAAKAAAAHAPAPNARADGTLAAARHAVRSVPHQPPLDAHLPQRTAPGQLDTRTVKLTLRLRHVVHGWLHRAHTDVSAAVQRDPLQALHGLLGDSSANGSFSAQVASGGSGMQTCPHVDVSGDMWKLPRAGGWCKDDSVWSLRHFQLQSGDGNMYRYRSAAARGDIADVLDLRRLFMVKCTLEHAVQHPWTAGQLSQSPPSVLAAGKQGPPGAKGAAPPPSSAIALQVTGRYAGQDFTRSFIAGAVTPDALQAAATAELPPSSRLVCLLQCRVWLAALLNFAKITNFAKSMRGVKAAPPPACWDDVMLPCEAVRIIDTADVHRRNMRRKVLNAEQYARECAEVQAMASEDSRSAAVCAVWGAERGRVLALRTAAGMRRLTAERSSMASEDSKAQCNNAVWRRQEASKRRLLTAVAALQRDLQSAVHEAGSASARIGALHSQHQAAAHELQRRQAALHQRQQALLHNMLLPVYRRLVVWVPPLLVGEGGVPPAANADTPPLGKSTGSSMLHQLAGFVTGDRDSPQRPRRQPPKVRDKAPPKVRDKGPHSALPQGYISRRRRVPPTSPCSTIRHHTRPSTPRGGHTMDKPPQLQLPASPLSQAAPDEAQHVLHLLLPLHHDRWGRVALSPPTKLYQWLTAQSHTGLLGGGGADTLAVMQRLQQAQQHSSDTEGSFTQAIRSAGVRYVKVHTSLSSRAAPSVEGGGGTAAMGIDASLLQKLNAEHAGFVFVLKGVEQPPGELLQGGDLLLGWGGILTKHTAQAEEAAQRCVSRVLHKGAWVEVARPVGRVPASCVGKAPPVQLWAPPSAEVPTVK